METVREGGKGNGREGIGTRGKGVQTVRGSSKWEKASFEIR